ncbi:hypothetical protein ZIOFF_063362 [Zingiber officinale]|uniref:Uncharacterized protein n=1 Tax=Zingiber officinale TaxID=94328 RepID=A0A8J5F2E2_ZINOF|nr:hypothetical protein ZIOFF_063362 [Zingiber officinale]
MFPSDFCKFHIECLLAMLQHPHHSAPTFIHPWMINSSDRSLGSSVNNMSKIGEADVETFRKVLESRGLNEAVSAAAVAAENESTNGEA